jgi:RND family efflux transporter MFP subunit
VQVGQELLQLDVRDIQLQVITDEIAIREVDANIAHQSSIIKGLRADYAAGAASRDQVMQAEGSLSLLQVQREKAVARVNQTRARLEQSVLRSPIAGTVTEINIRPGEVAVAGQPVITVSDSANQQIVARIEQYDARDLRIDMPVRVSLEGARGLNQDERILRIEPAVRKEGNAGYTAAWVSLRPSALRLRHNQQVDVRIPIGSDKSVTRIPIEALTSHGGTTVAWSIDSQGSLRPLAIAVGKMGDRFAEVLSGVSPGQVVVLVEGRTFNEGDQARAKIASKP